MSFKLKKDLVLILLTIILNSCINNQKKNYIGGLTLRDSFNLKISDGLKSTPFFGLQYVFNKSDTFIAKLFKNRLTLIELADSSKSFEIELPSKHSLDSNFNIAKIIGDNLYILEYQNSSVSRYQIDITKKSILEMPNLKIPVSLNSLSDTGYSIRFNPKTTFEIMQGNFFLSYSKNGSFRTNYFDYKPFMQFRLENDTLTLGKAYFSEVPKEILTQNTFFSTVYLRELNQNNLILGFSSFDSIYIFDIKRNIISFRRNFNVVSNFKKFDREKATDLYYAKNFELTDEKNVAIESNSKIKKIAVVKRLRREEVSKTVSFDCFILNDFLEVVGQYRMDRQISEKFCMPYRNGFLFLSSTESKFYYYECTK